MGALFLFQLMTTAILVCDFIYVLVHEHIFVFCDFISVLVCDWVILSVHEWLQQDIYLSTVCRYSTGVSTPHRHVKTRLYFTSESHIHSLLAILRYGGLVDVSVYELIAYLFYNHILYIARYFICFSTILHLSNL